jgi:hypothetical protein
VRLNVQKERLCALSLQYVRRQKELDGIALDKLIGGVCARAVYLDLLGTDCAIQHRLRQARKGLLQKFIQPLTCIVFLDFHKLQLYPLPSSLIVTFFLAFCK